MYLDIWYAIFFFTFVEEGRKLAIKQVINKQTATDVFHKL